MEGLAKGVEMMDDLISRKAAIKAIYNSMRYGEGYKGICARAIERVPAVDAVTVVHGRWTYFNCVWNGRYQCSECQHWVDAGLDRNYCPNCGAKMGGDANG